VRLQNKFQKLREVGLVHFGVHHLDERAHQVLVALDDEVCDQLVVEFPEVVFGDDMVVREFEALRIRACGPVRGLPWPSTPENEPGHLLAEVGLLRTLFGLPLLYPVEFFVL